jgi:mercuric ion transport protein
VGGVIAAICCFTPALVILLGFAGLSAWLAWLDYVLLPVLALFVGIAIYAGVRLARKSAPEGEVGDAT